MCTFMFLEDSKWNNANAYCEKVLDVKTENVHAYLGQLVAKIGIKKQEDLPGYVGQLIKNKE